MPKLKTHSGTKKKVRLSKTGKVLVRRSGGHKFLEKKRANRKRKYSGLQELSGKIVKTIKKRLAA
ncbi:50S ribosomal protein L35 [Candidatus Saccharibacteria bacterium]|nr:50S ribosomal protein L35 [Candidatus Saccharibacteria bacterium]